MLLYRSQHPVGEDLWVGGEWVEGGYSEGRGKLITARIDQMVALKPLNSVVRERCRASYSALTKPLRGSFSGTSADLRGLDAPNFQAPHQARAVYEPLRSRLNGRKQLATCPEQILTRLRTRYPAYAPKTAHRSNGNEGDPVVHVEARNAWGRAFATDRDKER